jgi:hypothetical protein
VVDHRLPHNAPAADQLASLREQHAARAAADGTVYLTPAERQKLARLERQAAAEAAAKPA